jgi:hypothetical protein
MRRSFPAGVHRAGASRTCHPGRYAALPSPDPIHNFRSYLAAVIPQHVRDFIAKWATNPQRRELVEDFVARVLELGNAEVELGRSRKSPDGLNKYLMLRHIGIRRQGAAVYVSPHLGRARFHLPTKETQDHKHAQALKRAGPYQVAVYLTSPASVDEALELAEKALKATAP